MASNHDKLLASRDAALAAKVAFESTYERDLSNCAVGLGLSRDGQDWALKVYVQAADPDAQLPPRFDRFEVDVEFAGQAAAC